MVCGIVDKCPQFIGANMRMGVKQNFFRAMKVKDVQNPFDVASFWSCIKFPSEYVPAPAFAKAIVRLWLTTWSLLIRQIAPASTHILPRSNTIGFMPSSINRKAANNPAASANYDYGLALRDIAVTVMQMKQLWGVHSPIVPQSEPQRFENGHRWSVLEFENFSSRTSPRWSAWNDFHWTPALAINQIR